MKIGILNAETGETETRDATPEEVEQILGPAPDDPDALAAWLAAGGVIDGEDQDEQRG